MTTDYSFEGMVAFLDYAADHGLWKATTAKSYATAAAKVQDELTEQEAADVRLIDLDLIFQRFVNRNKVAVSPGTLRTYKRRLGTAIEEFVAWREDPTAYRPKLGTRDRAPSEGPSKPKQQRTERREPTGAEPAPESVPVETPKGLLTIPFPLRSDFVVSVQVPRDLTSKEATRISAFIKTLAIDFGEGD